MANSFIPTSLSLTSTFQQLSTLLEAAGITDALESPVASLPGYIKNNDTAIAVYIGQGTSEPSNWATIAPEAAILFDAGLNANEIWLKCASSTVTADFVEGASEYAPPLVNGVIGTITATEGDVPMADADGNLVASSISDDGAGTVSIASDVTATGTLTSDDATTPALIIASGNTNTGYIDLFGKTSGKIRITTADATAQTINITAAAQTSGASTITIPDLAGASTAPVFTSIAQTLTNKTLTAPIIATGGKIVDAGGDEYVVFTEAATPVTYIGITSGNTGVAPQLRGAGEANTSLLLAGTGTGNVTIGDGADVTKLLSVELSGATTAKTMTIASSQTDDRTITLPDATGTVALTSNINGGAKVYKALLAQTGTDAPVATVLENSLGGTLVWTRDNVGIYFATLAGAFTTDAKIWSSLRAGHFYLTGGDATQITTLVRGGDNYLILGVFDTTNGSINNAAELESPAFPFDLLIYP